MLQFFNMKQDETSLSHSVPHPPVRHAQEQLHVALLQSTPLPESFTQPKKTWQKQVVE